MLADKGVLEAACAVRPYLLEMLDPETAADVDAALAALLARGIGGEDVDEPVRAVLMEYEETEVFLRRVLEDVPHFRPPQVMSDVVKGYSGLPGDLPPVPAEKFRCPHGDYVWYRPAVGVPIPLCPTHHCPVEPVPAG